MTYKNEAGLEQISVAMATYNGSLYLKEQLQAFASGQRTNDINQQMRNIARALTPQEIDEAAAYYASQPPDIVKATD